MKISTAFPSKYLKAADLDGKTYRMTIRGVQMEDMGGEGGDEKPILYFTRGQKGVVLNRTNADALSIVFGEETNAWVGKQIDLYPERVAFKGQMTWGIRMKARVEPIDGAVPGLQQPIAPVSGQRGPGETAAAAASRSNLDDEIPF